MSTVGRVNVVYWIVRIIAWDGLLPLGIVLAPTAIERLFPNQKEGFLDLFPVWITLAAFVLRYAFGKRHIDSNDCSPRVRRFQFVVFCVGVVLLGLVEGFVMILSRMGPIQELFEDQTCQLVFATLAAIYLTLMSVAMYPGRAPPRPSLSPYPQFNA